MDSPVRYFDKKSISDLREWITELQQNVSKILSLFHMDLLNKYSAYNIIDNIDNENAELVTRVCIYIAYKLVTLYNFLEDIKEYLKLIEYETDKGWAIQPKKISEWRHKIFPAVYFVSQYIMALLDKSSPASEIAANTIHDLDVSIQQMQRLVDEFAFPD